MFEVMNVLQSSNARLLHHAHLGDALQLAWWHNEHDATGYQQPGHHTLSVYVKGGEGTHFVGERDANVGDQGAPWRCCILPAEHESAWVIEQPFQFLHLYVSPQAWADRVVRLLDAEPRTHTLVRRIFGEDPLLAQWAQTVLTLDWADADQRWQAHAWSHHMLDHLVLQAARPAMRAAVVRPKGGLSASVRRRLLAYIDAHLSDNAALSLGQLAQEAHLSEFHLARMFRLSMGCSIHGWIVQQRLVRACHWLTHSTLHVTEIAWRCGFHSSSHLHQAIKKHLHTTPLHIRQAGVFRKQQQKK